MANVKPRTKANALPKDEEATNVEQESSSKLNPSEILEEIKSENDALKAQLTQALEALKLVTEQVKIPIEQESEIVQSDSNATKSAPKKPASDELIKVMSLCYGTLNLPVDGVVKMKFEKFGDVHSIKYGSLVDIVTQNRKKAENGRFYILHEGAVYDLDLAEKFERIFPAEVINRITTYSDADITDMLNIMVEGQKTNLIRILADKIFLGKNVDLNKVSLISKITGVDIVEKAKQAEKVKENAPKKN